MISNLCNEFLFSQNRRLYSQVGISFNFGSKINRLGVVTYFGGYTNFFQANMGLRVFYNFNTYGPSNTGLELQTSIGILFGYGKIKSQTQNFYSSVSNHTQYNNSCAYVWNYYFDKQQTSQPTGIVSFEFGNFQIIHENDLFGHSSVDKYRTAAIKLAYTDSVLRFAINVEMWTGDTKAQPRVRNTDYPARAGYIDMSDAPFAQHSSGILSFQFDYALPYQQVIRLESGLDSEKVRHVLQNKIIHDWVFIPKGWLSNDSYNLHVPMLDTNHEQYLFKPEQEIKKARVYMNFSGNPGVFY